VLITGASGFVGRTLSGEAVSRGLAVLGATRTQHDLPADASNIVVPSVDGSTDWRDALPGCSALVHLAARVHVMQETTADSLTEFRKVNVQGTLNLARQAAAAGVRRFVFASSIKVNGEATQPGERFTAEDAVAPLDAYGISKMEAEQGLRLIAQQTVMEVVIIRPPLV
jgi:nucleoside-diphosphate-sugar epimerase